jgi:serine protease Do
MTHSMRQVFKEALGDSWKSTVRLLNSEEQVALGAIVDSEGWVVTKCSQLPASGEMVCRLFDGREVAAKVSNKVIDLDIALLKVEAKNLIPISWVDQVTPQRGKWLATTDGRSLPLKVGVVSAGIQSIKSEFPKLGISFSDNAKITMVLPGSGAYVAGLKVDDVIYSINEQSFDANEKGVISRLQNAIKTGGRAGEHIRIGIVRGDRRLDVEAQLMDLTYELLDETEMEVNGRVSARATGFSSVFLHDTVLEPNECGGPLVNLDGQVMGINIARASRVTSYALPASAVRSTIENMISQAKLVSRPVVESNSLDQPIR